VSSSVVNVLHVLTVGVGIVAANIASKGNFFTNIFVYPADFISVLIFIVLAKYVVIFVLKALDKNSKVLSVVIPFIYFHVVFSCFLDGYSAGWSHTESLLGKLFLAMFLLSVVELRTGYFC